MNGWMDHTKRQHCGRCWHSSRSYTRVLFLTLCLLTFGPILKSMESISIFMQIYMPTEVKQLTVALSQQCLREIEPLAVGTNVDQLFKMST